jgi:hypothetical protein
VELRCCLIVLFFYKAPSATTYQCCQLAKISAENKILNSLEICNKVFMLSVKKSAEKKSNVLDV